LQNLDLKKEKKYKCFCGIAVFTMTMLLTACDRFEYISVREAATLPESPSYSFEKENREEIDYAFRNKHIVAIDGNTFAISDDGSPISNIKDMFIIHGILSNKPIEKFDNCEYIGADKNKIVLLTESGDVRVIGTTSYQYKYSSFIDRTASIRYIKLLDDDAIFTIDALGFQEFSGVGNGNNYNLLGVFDDIAEVEIVDDYAIVLHRNGTVSQLFLNKNSESYSYQEIDEWHDIVHICANTTSVVGLTANGNVLYEIKGQKEKSTTKIDFSIVSSWTNMIDIDMDEYTIVGINKDGYAYASGDNEYGQCDVNTWYDIVEIDTGGKHTVGVKKDGTVLAVGKNKFGECNVQGWIVKH